MLDIKPKKLLLHSCCGPCSTAVITRLLADYAITVFYFNPNITSPEEYKHRKLEQIRFLNEFSASEGRTVELLQGDYDPAVYYRAVQGLEQEPECGLRCTACFKLRLEETVQQAKSRGYDCFDTTLTVSPHKNFKVIEELGRALEKSYGIEYLGGNYKKKDGYRLSVDLSNAYGLYRQSYCGCSFSEVQR